MSNSVTGQIFFIGQTEQPTQSFTKRSFILIDESNPQYPQYIPMELTQNNVGLLDQFHLGQQVMVEYNMRGNLSKTPDPNTGAPRAFLTLQAWRITAQTGVHPQQQVASQAAAPNQGWNQQQQGYHQQGANTGYTQAPPPVATPSPAAPTHAPAQMPPQPYPQQVQPAPQPSQTGAFQVPPPTNNPGF